MMWVVPSPRFFRALLAILLVGAAACSSYEVPQGPAPAATTSPPPKVFVGGPEMEAVQADDVDLTTVGAPVPDPIPGPGDWTVRTSAATLNIWTGPDVDATVRFAVETTNPWDQPIVYPIERAKQSDDGTIWYRIRLGIEPNGSAGWVRASDVTMERATDRIVVDMSNRKLRHFRNGKLRHHFRIAIGAPDTPTTTGHFFVWAHLLPTDPNGSYGSYLLGLSGFSEVLTSMPGGGRMAIHGTSDPSDRGQAVSSGCVRVYNPDMDRLQDVPMGTVVVIRP